MGGRVKLYITVSACLIFVPLVVVPWLKAAKIGGNVNFQSTGWNTRVTLYHQPTLAETVQGDLQSAIGKLRFTNSPSQSKPNYFESKMHPTVSEYVRSEHSSASPRARLPQNTDIWDVDHDRIEDVLRRRSTYMDYRSSTLGSTVSSAVDSASIEEKRLSAPPEIPFSPEPLNKVKTIMLWNGWQILQEVYNDVVFTNFELTSSRLCRYKCKMVLQHQASESHQFADLVIFDVNGLPFEFPIKFQDQLWMLHTMESPFRVPFDLSRYNGLINYTFTVNTRSTVVDRYGNTQKLLQGLPMQDYATKKRALGSTRYLNWNALWYVSNCGFVRSGRLEYTNDLARYMSIDVVTKDMVGCGSLVQGARVNPPLGSCELCDYTFYLSFENALCKSYITEKFWKILASDALAIPIVMGGYSTEDYASVAPPNSFIDVANFTSPMALVQHLEYIIKNDAAFNYYHEWRRNYVAHDIRYNAVVPPSVHETDGSISPYCKICEMAHERPFQVVEHLDAFYSVSDCHQVMGRECQFYNLTCSTMT